MVIKRVCTVLVAVVLMVSPAEAASDPGTAGVHEVVTTGYDLGDTAFAMPGFRIELTATVHHPRHLGAGKYPLVVLMHGFWETCADRRAGDEYWAALKVLSGPEASTDPAERQRAEDTADRTTKLLWQWPCAPGTPSMPSYRGYDSLGRQLASHGYVVVSVSANGVNAGPGGEVADAARVALINKHLELWQRLSQGKGPLVTRLGTGFREHVDLNRVGTLGHSRAGRAVMSHAADVHRNQWPAGVSVKAVVPLAPAGYYAPDPEAPENDGFRVTTVPFATIIGTCDQTSNPGGKDYFANSAGRNRKPISELTFHGANHNAYNSQWSPSSGQVLAHDDVERAVQLGYATRPKPGYCDDFHTGADERQLGEQRQRDLGNTLISAFFRRHLGGETWLDPMLTGALPVPGVDVRYQR